jgi:hypothetical protein
MGVGPNYVLDKGHLAQGATAYAFGELVVPGTVEQSVTRATTAGAMFAYVCQEDVDATRIATGKVFVDCRMLGIARVIAGAAVAKSAKLTNDTSARAVTQAGAVGSGAPVLGIALTAAANAGDQIDVLLTPGATA